MKMQRSTRYSVSVKPDLGARVGHSFAEWNTARIIARLLGASFSHSGLGNNALQFNSVIGIDQIPSTPLDYTLPSLYLSRFESVTSDLLRHGSDRGLNIVLDFFINGASPLFDQTQMMHELIIAFSHARSLCPCFSYSRSESDSYCVALHLRKGDVISDRNRQASIDYYRSAVSSVIRCIPDSSEIITIVFTDGSKTEVESSLPFLLERSPIIRSRYSEIVDLISMINSDYLVAAKSGYSYLAHLLKSNLNSIVVPSGFWHKWRDDVVIVEDAGSDSGQTSLVASSKSDYPPNPLFDLPTFPLSPSWQVIASDLRDGCCPVPAFSILSLDADTISYGLSRMPSKFSKRFTQYSFEASEYNVLIASMPSILFDSANQRFLVGGSLDDVPRSCWQGLEISQPSILIQPSLIGQPTSQDWAVDLALIFIYARNKLFQSRTLYLPDSVDAEEVDRHAAIMPSLGVNVSTYLGQPFILFTSMLYLEIRCSSNDNTHLGR